MCARVCLAYLPIAQTGGVPLRPWRSMATIGMVTLLGSFMPPLGLKKQSFFDALTVSSHSLNCFQRMSAFHWIYALRWGFCGSLVVGSSMPVAARNLVRQVLQ